jgi:chorismate synthase
MNVWGKNIRLSIFGESHGPAIGIVIDGLPAGFEPDMDGLRQEMARRAPGGKGYATARTESDEPEILSGFHNGRTTGAPLACLIRNADQRSGDYGDFFRPGHADWTAFLKYGGFADMRGGGHFSGRLTAPLVFAGALAKQLIAPLGFAVYGRIASIAGLSDGLDLTETNDFSHDGIDIGWLKRISEKAFAADDRCEAQFLDMIELARRAGDSVGGEIEAVAFGDTAGLGEPFFGSLESRLSSLLFSVPSVKGVAFGKGFAFAGMTGSIANDSLGIKDGSIYARTNHNGGVLGGIASGMPIILRVAIKPTASIATQQDSVMQGQAGEMAETRIHIHGRHDPCIVPRAVPVIETCVALTLLDLLMDREAGALWRSRGDR